MLKHIIMKTINKKYTFTEEDALAHATFYGYNTKVVDETKLDENGNVPLIDLIDEEGNPVYEQEFDAETVTETGNKLDAEGNPIPVKVPMDVYIDNPVTPVEFLSTHFDEFVKEWFIAPVQKQMELAAKAAQKEAEATAKITLENVEQGIKSKITTVIE